MNANRNRLLILVLGGALGLSLGTARPALADQHGWDHHWGHHGWDHRGWGHWRGYGYYPVRPGIVVAPPAVVVAPPVAVVAPPPVVVVPPVAVLPPSINVTIPLGFR